MVTQKEFAKEYLGTFEQPKQQSDLLTQFYQAYVWWLDAGASEEMGFCRHMGLCGNLRKWANRNAQVEYPQLAGELQTQFDERSLHFLHPFHATGLEFNEESDRNECHLNTKRIQWARNHAAV